MVLLRFIMLVFAERSWVARREKMCGSSYRGGPYYILNQITTMSLLFLFCLSLNIVHVIHHLYTSSHIKYLFLSAGNCCVRSTRRYNATWRNVELSGHNSQEWVKGTTKSSQPILAGRIYSLRSSYTIICVE